MSEPLIRRRAAGDDSRLPANLHPVLRRVYAARGLTGPEELSLDLGALQPPAALQGIEAATELLAQAIKEGRRIVVAGDYDADGATATAVAVLGLRMLGAAQVGYVVPNRFTMGYGLSPPLVELARAKRAELLVTVDNGIASLAGVAAARAAGLQVLITDHHLAGTELPAADAIVNPNQPGCGFASKHLAGVGVMFYVLLALRARLRAAGAFPAGTGPRLAELLDLVALGTVADVVRLDANNRILVAQGLARIRAGRARSGVLALFEAAGRDHRQASAGDLGFVVGPRLNAAGRLEDMTVGIECLLAPDLVAARPLAVQLDGYNRERRELEAQMRDEALALVEGSEAAGVCVYAAAWHEGVVGLVASRVKDRLHRPSFAFAPAGEPGLLKGSGRSIPGLHLRDALAAVDALHPGLIARFGGHAMAAGLSLAEQHYEAFAKAFDRHCQAQLDAEALHQRLETDGELATGELCLQTAQALEQGGPWGQGFPEPRFEGCFEIRELRRLGSEGRHIKYRLRANGGEIEAIDFNGAERALAAGCQAALVYRLVINRFRGNETVELQVEHLQG